MNLRPPLCARLVLLLAAASIAGCGDDSTMAGETDGGTTLGPASTSASATTMGTPTTSATSETTTSTEPATSSDPATSEPLTGSSTSAETEMASAGTSGSDSTSTGEVVPVVPRVMWVLPSTHGAFGLAGQGRWPVPRDGNGAPALDQSTVYGPLDELDVPMVFVEGVDNATVDNDPTPVVAGAMTRLLTASAMIGPVPVSVADGPSIDRVLGEALTDATPVALFEPYFAGAGGATRHPAVHAGARQPVQPFGDPAQTWDAFVGSGRIKDLDGFPANPPSMDPDDPAAIEAVLEFHFQMAAELLARRLVPTAVVQLGETEAFWTPSWLGADCRVQLIYHEEPSCTAATTWDDVMVWTTQTVTELVAELQARTVEDGTSLLDHTVLVWMQDYGASGPHGLGDLPVVLIGGSALGSSGRRIVDAEGFDQADLALSIADLAGVDLDTFGDASHSAEIIPGLFE